MTGRRSAASVVFAAPVAFRYARVAASRVPPRQYPIALTRDSPVAFSDGVQRRDGAFEQVVVHALLRQPRIRIHPRDHEHGVSLVHRPLDERVLRAKIQDVVLVDPRRNDEQRTLAHRLRGGCVLEELDQIVFEDDLAGGDGDVLAQLELLQVGHPDPELALTPFEILEHVGKALHEILAARLDRPSGHLGIRHREIRRREGVDELASIEIHLVRGMRIEPFRLAHRGEHELRRQQIALLDMVVERVLGPGVVGEPAVPRFGCRYRLDVFPGHAPRRVLPKLCVVLPQRDLRFDQALGVGQHLLPQRLIRLRHHRGLERIELAGAARLPFDERLHDALALLGDAAHRCVQALRVRIRWGRGRLVAHGSSPPEGCRLHARRICAETILGDGRRSGSPSAVRANARYHPGPRPECPPSGVVPSRHRNVHSFDPGLRARHCD